MLFKKSSVLILGFFVLCSCATFNKQTKPNSNLNEGNNSEVEHSFYLIGDAGNATAESSTIALSSLKKALNEANSNATVLFLGDNIYPKGLPSKKSESRALAEHRLKVQIESVEGFTGKTIFIPGNHDWYSDGDKGLDRQQEYVEKQLGKNSFLPKDGCPIKRINISDDIVLIIVDSQWYITNWDKYPTINSDCELNTRHLFLDEFRDEIKKARGKTTLVAIHHPMFSNGPHGGQYSVKHNLTPLPVVGTLKNILRETSGAVNADLSNRYYTELKKNLVAAAQQNDRVIFLSGHEHSLQYLSEENIPQIISGSGSKTSATRNVKGGQFSYGVNGFAILDIFKDHSSNVRFISAKENKIEFQTQVFKPDANEVKIEYPVLRQVSIQKSILSLEETSKSKTYKFLWGERFREDFSTPVTAKVVYLDTLLGGLTPIRKGGGNQSKSLHLKTADGQRYVMRALKKQAAQFIQAQMFKELYVQDKLENTSTANLVQDVYTGSYPYVTFIIGDLSEAIGLPHLNPALYYLPKQNALGRFNEEFGDELYMFEEQASEGHTELASGNFTGNIISNMDMLNEIQKNESKMIDEKEYIKARLFDMLIGDWDRHQDQWRWLEYKEDGKTIYKPLPRDRDQPFSKLADGLIMDLVLKLIPTARLLQNYDTDLKDVKGFNQSPFSLDVALITYSEKAVWDEQVQLIQTNITDDIIEQAFSSIPKEVNQETIAEIKETLKIRKDNLQKISDRYFKLLNKYAVITTSNKGDYIKIEAKEQGEVFISVSRIKGGLIQEVIHDRTYYPDQTKEIWVYALGDEDSFEVIGKSSKIKIRLIGGQNNDKYVVDKGKNVVIYDYKSQKNDVTEAKKATLKLQDRYDVNVYDYKKLKNNTNLLIPLLGFNPDDGLKIGISNSYTVYGFERNPFTSKHRLQGSFYFATNGFDLNYTGEFANVMGKINLKIESDFTSPNFTINFFGYGNETPNNSEELGEDYYRVRYKEFNVAPSLIWKGYGGVEVSLGLKYESIEVEETANRFVENNPQLPDYIFNENQFASINTKLEYENYDNKAYPTIGMATSIEIGNKTNLVEANRNFTYLIPEIGFVHKLNPAGQLVISTKLKGHINFNTNIEFYQGASIGGSDGPRGFRNQRFTGQHSFYQNTDLRYSFNRMKTSVLPTRVGIYGSFDYGRIWLDQGNSGKLNYSYGGGFFINVAELMSANLGAFYSTDGLRMAFTLGFGI